MYHIKFPALASVLIFICSSAVASSHNDWRKNGSNQTKLDNVIKVIPSTSNIMIQIGQRYQNLYWAGKQEKWAFAEYQVEEMESLIKTLKITRPKRTPSIDKYFSNAFEPVESAIKNKSWKQFSAGFEIMRGHCMACHKVNNHAFIILKATPTKGNSPVLD